MSLMNKITQFARSPQGRRFAGQAKQWAADPKNKEKVGQIRERFASRRGTDRRP